MRRVRIAIVGEVQGIEAENFRSRRIMAGAAIIAYGLTAFSLGVKYLRVVDHSLVEAEHKTVKVEAAEPMVV